MDAAQLLDPSPQERYIDYLEGQVSRVRVIRRIEEHSTEAYVYAVVQITQTADGLLVEIA